MILDRLDIGASDFEAATGWAIEPRGACRGDVCVPLDDDDDAAAGGFDLARVAGRLGMPVVHDAANGLWALGPATLGGHALTTAEAPELVLPDVDGNEFRLSSLRGRKVVLVAYAPY